MIENVLWLITARSGSKGIPNKNIKILGDIPLIGYQIKTALSISPNKNVWISTDSEDYAVIAKKIGAHIPFIRPPELATDTASSIDVVLHAMKYSEDLGCRYDYIGLLEPTSPFVYYSDIQNALFKLSEHKTAKCIVAVKESHPNTFFIQEESEFLDELGRRFEKANFLGRQSFKREITPSGGFYIARWNFFKQTKTFYSEYTLPYILPDESALEIDEVIDFEWAEFLIANNKVNFNKLYL